jgi:uncharacterized protein (TIGR03437 family)
MRPVLLGLLSVSSLFCQEQVRLSRVTGGLNNPTDIQDPRDGSGRLFFVQQNGTIRVFRNGALLEAPFLEIRSKISTGSERGLLGLVFPPDYARKQHFYVNYTDTRGDTVIALYRTSANPDVADRDSERILTTIAQPFANHNGGGLRFGPDGYLYIGLGDGGSAGDPRNNGQNPQARLGKMLRLDVESSPGEVRIPPDNPFVGNQAYLPEIWATGLRNPWRYSFDRETGDLWIGDVGQDRFEEIHFQPASSRGGENYGWNLMEGLSCFRANCSREGLTQPALDYGRGDGCSVTGGFVYRGSRSPALRGAYIYGDYCSGRIWGLRRDGERWRNELLIDTNLAISTFGEDDAGEIYVADHGRGEIWAIAGGSQPVFTAAGVVNAASQESGLVAGSLATIYVAGAVEQPGITLASRIPLPTELSGIGVVVNERRAPILGVANVNGQEQVNFQVPFEVGSGPTASVTVIRNGVSSAAVSVPVRLIQPGVFANGTDAIVVHHSDNALVSRTRPLERGEFAYFYATGLGPVDNNPGTGNGGPASPLARATSQPRVTLGGAPLEVLYAGLAPGFVGVFQINIRVSDAVPSGDAELLVSIGAESSRPLRVAVR